VRSAAVARRPQVAGGRLPAAEISE